MLHPTSGGSVGVVLVGVILVLFWWCLFVVTSSTKAEASSSSSTTKTKNPFGQQQRQNKQNQKYDWLIHQQLPSSSTTNDDNNDNKARIYENTCWNDGLCGIELTNGLFTRRFALLQQSKESTRQRSYCFGTVDLLMQDSKCASSSDISMLRNIEPEGFIKLNNQTYRLGDLNYKSGGFQAYLNRTSLSNNLDCLTTGENKTFGYVTHRIITNNNISKPFDWIPGTRHSLNNQQVSWPPKGIGLEIDMKLLSSSSTPTSSENDDDNIDNDDDNSTTSQSSLLLLPSNLIITIHYELYDNIPVMSKWISLSTTTTTTTSKTNEEEIDEVKSSSSSSSTKVIINSVTVERIASYPPYGAYFSHGSSNPYTFYNGQASGNTMSPPPLLVSLTDQTYGTQCNWIDDYINSNNTQTSKMYDYGASEPLLICNYTSGPNIIVDITVDDNNTNDYDDDAAETKSSTTLLFTSFRTILLATDSVEPERQSLMKRRMIQMLLPHTTENPIFFHAIVTEGTKQFKHIIDQMSQVGFELFIFSFGSTSWNLEDITNTTLIEQIKSNVYYAKSKGIEVGGYDLICLNRGHDGYGKPNIPDYWVREYLNNDQTNQTKTLSHDACFASGWYDYLFNTIIDFIKKTGITTLEMDGPYGGQTCSSTNHSHHTGYEDSIYQQTQLQNNFFVKLRNMGIYLNVPDTYFFQGMNRIGMGYDEYQYSLPRWEQLTISRMGMYDDLYRYLPTQGWMFMPLTQIYHSGGGDESIFNNHPLELYWGFGQYLGAGTAACYRGTYLYNETTSEGRETKSIMKQWIGFYKRHRLTLIQPIIHLRRPTLQSWDGWLHVNPIFYNVENEGGDGAEGCVDRLLPTKKKKIKEVGLAVLFNPTDRFLSSEIIYIPLYYTGLETTVWITMNDDDSTGYMDNLERDYSVKIVLDMKPKSINTISFQRIIHNYFDDESDDVNKSKSEQIM